MAVENDYNLLVFTLNNVAKEFATLKLEADKRLLQEKRDGLEPNATKWVNMIALRLPYIEPFVRNLLEGSQMVLHSRPGQAVFTEQPPEAPNAPP